MSGIAGPFFAAVALLGAAGIVKLVRPLSTAQALRSAGVPATPAWGRVLGAVELVVAADALVLGGRVAAAAVAACYLGFALFTARLLTLAGETSCGCFGAEDAPATPTHVALNLTAATAAALAAGWPPGDLRSFLAAQPWSGVPFLAVTALLAWLAYVSLALLPDLRRAMAEGAGRSRPGDTGAGDTGAGDTGAGDTGAGGTGAGDTAPGRTAPGRTR